MRPALRAALVDPAVPVALAAAESLVGTGRPSDVEFLLAEFEITAPGPELGYVLWGILMQQQSLNRLLVHEGMEQKLKIKFDKAGVKTVMVRFANLEPA